MDIFKVEKNIVKVTAHALLIPEFAKIWDRDKSEMKSTATLELSYIEFCLSGRKSNPFAGYTDDERPGKVVGVLNLGEGWRPDRVVVAAMNVYDKLQIEGAQSYRYYKSITKALDKLIEFYTYQLDFAKTTSSGASVYKPKDITDAISKAAVNMQQVQKIRDQVEKDLFEANKTIKNRAINEYERVDRSNYKARTEKYT